MLTETRTDAEIIEVLATKGMGWRKHMSAGPDATEVWLELQIPGGKRTGRTIHRWNPLTDLNACHEVEERLTEEQRHEYLQALFRSTDKAIMTEWEYCHADARTRAYALAEVLRGGKDAS